MQSFLIVSKNKNEAASYISDLLKEMGVNSLDINLQTYEKTMGIEDVRNIQKAILLKPFRGKTKAVIINAYENITFEAQNSLLKILEEPPANTIIIIATSKKEFLLPTIISRCKIVYLWEKEIKLIQEDFLELQDALSIIMNGKTGDKLKTAQDIASNRGDMGLWLEKMAIFTKNKLAEDDNIKYLNLLKELQKTYRNIKSTNVSKRVAIENLFLSL
jgi:DNA polymerase III delta prime subunit